MNTVRDVMIGDSVYLRAYSNGVRCLMQDYNIKY